MCLLTEGDFAMFWFIGIFGMMLGMGTMWVMLK